MQAKQNLLAEGELGVFVCVCVCVFVCVDLCVSMYVFHIVFGLWDEKYSLITTKNQIKSG